MKAVVPRTIVIVVLITLKYSAACQYTAKLKTSGRKIGEWIVGATGRTTMMIFNSDDGSLKTIIYTDTYA